MTQKTLVLGFVNFDGSVPEIEVLGYSIKTLQMRRIKKHYFQLGDEITIKWFDLDHMYLRNLPQYTADLTTLLQGLAENYVYIELACTNYENSTQISIGLPSISSLDMGKTESTTAYVIIPQCNSFVNHSDAVRRRQISVAFPILRDGKVDEDIFLQCIEHLVQFVRECTNI